MNGLALCAGVGGLELGLKLAIGDAYRCVGYCERDSFSASCLMARMEETRLDKAPIWDDLTTFPSGLYRGKVDLISAGFPCQPVSTAGRRKITEDDRWLFPWISRIISEVGPRILFLENVRGLLVGGGADSVFGELADLGFDAEWDVFSAEEVGASHERERIFILAYAQSLRSESGGEQSQDGLWNGLRESGKTLVESAGEGLEGFGEQETSWTAFGFPPGPSESEIWKQYDGPKPSIRRGDDGLAFGVDRIRSCGNGVVPLVAAHAFRTLAIRAGLK